MSEANVTQSAESAVHAALVAAAQRICDEHGIRVEAVTFEWVETTRASDRGRSFYCTGSSISSSRVSVLPNGAGA